VVGDVDEEIPHVIPIRAPIVLVASLLVEDCVAATLTFYADSSPLMPSDWQPKEKQNLYLAND
jgi:hypothetical protein